MSPDTPIPLPLGAFGTRLSLVPNSPLRQLGARAYEVAALVACGKTNAGICAELDLTETTVGNHLTNIYSRMGIAEDCNARVALTLMMLRDSSRDPFATN
jgi:DNA-binding NarL/FixJ family response regulator